MTAPVQAAQDAARCKGKHQLELAHQLAALLTPNNKRLVNL